MDWIFRIFYIFGYLEDIGVLVSGLKVKRPIDIKNQCQLSYKHNTLQSKSQDCVQVKVAEVVAEKSKKIIFRGGPSCSLHDLHFFLSNNLMLLAKLHICSRLYNSWFVLPNKTNLINSRTVKLLKIEKRLTIILPFG